MESQRQKKIASVLQRDLVEVLQGAATQGGMKGILISVTKVNVTVDLSIAKVYLSIFPIDRGAELLGRHSVQCTAHQARAFATDQAPIASHAPVNFLY